MTDRSSVLELLAAGVPLRLLFDIAGCSDSSVDICAAERPELPRHAAWAGRVPVPAEARARGRAQTRVGAAP